MKTIARTILLALITISAQSYAQERWESATNVTQERTGDAMLTRCIYETLGGYRFSIVVRGLCPFSVKVSPETGEVRK